MKRLDEGNGRKGNGGVKRKHREMDVLHGARYSF